ncbi:MAG TPA: DUF4193 family protein [Actinomycetota bacterium]|jgi:hypothetical protein
MSTDDIDDIDTPAEDDEIGEDEDGELEDAEPSAQDLEEATVPPEPGIGQVESIQDILAKQESATETQEQATEDEDEAAVATMTRDEKLEPLDARVVPIQTSEFTCTNCFLVKHRSQLANKKKMLCRDCA